MVQADYAFSKKTKDSYISVDYKNNLVSMWVKVTNFSDLHFVVPGVVLGVNVPLHHTMLPAGFVLLVCLLSLFDHGQDMLVHGRE